MQWLSLVVWLGLAVGCPTGQRCGCCFSTMCTAFTPCTGCGASPTRPGCDLCVCWNATSLPSMQSPPECTVSQLRANMQSSPVLAEAAVRISFQSCPGRGWELQLRWPNGSLLHAASGQRQADHRLQLPACPACRFSWVARASGQPWSSPQYIITPAPLGPAIWAADNASRTGPEFAFLRGKLPSLQGPIQSALLYVTADGPGRAPKPGPIGSRPLLGGYKAWLGGKLVGIGPGRSKCDLNYAQSSPALCPHGVESVFDAFDVTPLMHAASELLIEAYGYDQPNVTRRVAAAVWVRYINGTIVCPLCDPTAWTAYDADGIYLARLWKAGGGGHSKAQLSSSGGGAWYYAPHEYLDLTLMPPEMRALSFNGSGAGAANGWHPAVRKPPFANLIVRNVPPVEILPRQPASSLRSLGAGVFGFDMGREIQGGLVLELSLTRAVEVRVRFGEELLKPEADPLTAGFCTATAPEQVDRVCFNMRTGSRYEDVWVLPAAPDAMAQNHEYIEGRYGELVFNDTSITLESILFVGAFVVRQRYDQPAVMNSSSALLDAVWELCRYTSEATSLDMYSDSNARQRSIDCMADDNTAMRTAYATSSSLALQRYALQQALTICGSGALGAGGCRFDWTVLPIVMARDDALHTGDLTFLHQHFDHLMIMMELEVLNRTDSSGLLNRSDCLIDWPYGMQDRYDTSAAHSTVANAFAHYSLTYMAEMAGWLGRTAEQGIYTARAVSLRAAIATKLWNGTAFCDGICGEETTHTSFHASVHMLALGAVESKSQQLAAWEYVRGRIDPPFEQEVVSSWPPPPPPGSRDGMPCGTYVSQFVLQALYAGNPSDKGRAALAVLQSDAKNSWGNMLKQGATTTMEMWSADEKPNLTWSHPWASSPGFIIPWFLFGLTPTSPGFDMVSIKPAPGELRHGSYTMPTIKGPIRASFTSNSGESFTLDLDLPVGVSAIIALPAASDGKQYEFRVDGQVVKSTATDDGYITTGSQYMLKHLFSLHATGARLTT